MNSCHRHSPGDPIAIGTRRELFVDDFLLETLDNAELRLHAPIPREIAVEHDTDWEGNTSGYHTVLQDEGLYRMYYRGSHCDSYGVRRKTHPQFACYAESTDGVHWTKPELGLFEFNGSKANNIIWEGEGCHNFVPFKDSNPDCAPDARYKALGGDRDGLLAFASPDGIHWRPLGDGRVITEGAFDSQNLAFWDTRTQCYREFHREFERGVRGIMTGTSQDFIHWSKPTWIEFGTDTPAEQLYTNQICQYVRAPHLYFGFPKRFSAGRIIPGNLVGAAVIPGISDGVFMSSRDGIHFQRWLEAWIRPGLQRERWENRNNMTAWGIVTTKSDLPGTPEELSVYSTEHYYQGEACKIRRHSLRLDGFVSVNAPMAGGSLLTKTLTFAAPETPLADPGGWGETQPEDSYFAVRQTKWGEAMLLLNASTSGAGSIRCEIRTAEGAPIPGFTLDECDTFFGDGIECAISWNGGNSELKSLAGQSVRFYFELKDADLYALRIGQPE